MRWPVAPLAVFLALASACEDIPGEKPSCFGVANACGIHATCDLASGSCLCDPGYVGPSCSTCAPGYQDKNGNGSCEPGCSATGAECGPRAHYSDQSGIPACACIVGYSRTLPTSSGSPSTLGSCDLFVGGPADPNFTGSPPNVWTTTGEAALEDGGVRFSGAGELSQSFDMPNIEESYPVQLQLVSSEGYGNIHVGFDGVECRSGLNLCLGERAFGHTVRFSVRVDGRPAGTEDLSIVEARFFSAAGTSIRGETGRALQPCPALGQVYDGDFEPSFDSVPQVLAPTLWPGIEDPSTVALVHTDRFASNAARLIRSCGAGPIASMTTSVSVPLALDSPALIFSLTGTKGAATDVRIDGESIGKVEATGDAQHIVLCVPKSSRGFAPPLTVEALPDPTCAVVENIVTVDDFILASDPSCGSSQ